MDELKAANEQWQDTTLKEYLEQFPELQDSFTTESGIPVKRLYTPLDLEEEDYAPIPGVFTQPCIEAVIGR